MIKHLALLLALLIAGPSFAGSPAQNLVLFGKGTPLYSNLTNGQLPGWLSASGGANGTVTNSSGVIVSASAPRFDYTGGTANGLLIEEGRTNVALYSRDLTNAAWTLGATMTSAKNQTGVDGVVNSASSITGGAVSATNTILQSITLASSARAQSAYVKGITVTGNIQMTMDGGTTWTTLTSSNCVSVANGVGTAPASSQSVWLHCQIPIQTIANPSVGFKIANSSDSVAVDIVDNENGAFITSPIITTSAAVTRSADVITFVGTGLKMLQVNATSAVVETGAINNLATSFPIIVSTSTKSILYTGSIFTNLGNNVGSNNLQVSGSSIAISPSRSGIEYSYNLKSIVLNGGTTGSISGTGYIPTTPIYVGSSGAAQFLDGYVRKIAIYPYVFSLAVLKSKTIAGAPLP
jgi:hypothetical protein